MSAVFTGNGLGLFNTSLDQLGYGLGQGAGVGQGRENRYLNVATGNLVWQSADEHLVFRGLTIGLARTYNSLGEISDVGADGWITGFERRIALQSGGFNASGSVMRRYTGDGAHQDFVYQSANVYRSTDGDGAHDTLTWTGDHWIYAEGSSRREEQYASQADPVEQGRLTHIRDLRSDGTTPASWVVIYDANQRISEIRAEDGTSTGEAMLFGYDAAGHLSSISTREAGVVRHQVAYEYDAQGRLAAVVSDLTIGNTGDNTWSSTAAQNDGRLFRTQYSYEGTSLRLAGVTQSDGTKAVFTYYADGRLKSASQGDSGQVITYAYAAGSTTVTDSLGRSWIYGYDQAGQLTSVTAPAIAGQSDVTAYQYDAAGNLTQVKTTGGTGILSQVDYLHDAAGNVTWEWDALGNAVSRSWNSANQLVSVTHYTGIDPDGAGATLPTGGATTRYVYDAQSRLRFAIDALGQVSELTYATAGNGIGQKSSQRIYLGASYAGSYELAGLEAWATAAQKAESQLSELIYDAWGRLSQRNDYAAVDASGMGVLDARANVERYTYDAQGLLRQQTVLRGASRTADGAAPSGSQQIVYTYDGMGRLLSTTQRQVGSTDTDITTLLTTYAYLDSGHQVLVTDDAGQVVVQTRDSAGRLISVSSRGAVAGVVQVRTTTNFYDAAGQLRATEDAAGGRSYLFYDAKGRLEATVDATGAVSRSYYDAAGRIVGTRSYANRVTTTSWVSAGQVVPTQVDALGLTNNALDHVASRTYDTAGRLLTETDGPESSATRIVTTYTYDGKGQLLQTRSTDAAGTAGTARLQRYFYDPAGRQVGSLDAAGYLTELQYDRAGRVVSQTRYATVSPPAHWAAGTLVQLRPASNPEQDQTTRFFHDGRGQLVGQLDAEGYLTQWVLDEAGNSRAERRYATALVWGAADTLTTLLSRAGSFREKRMSYNALGQLATQVNVEGTVTRYSYDDAGRLLKTEVAQGTSEVREGHKRYNVFGELIGELSGEAALQVLPDMTEAQLDAVYAQYGLRHGYDVLGRRIETIDAAGNRSWYFYNAGGQQTFVVRGVADENNLANALGEVTEQRYNAFGQATDAISYTGRITLSVAGSRSSVEAALSTLSYVATTDAHRQYTYTNRGQLASSIDAEGGIRQYSYDAFGDLRVEQSWVGTSSATTTQYHYDLRGLQIRVIEAVGSALEREQSVTLDAFGRITTSTDARGSLRTQTYDRLGRQLTSQQVVGSRPESTSVSYDAYDRVLSSTDAMGRVTQQVHDDAARSVTITSPEGVVVTTLHNRHGQSIRITDAQGYSEYVYNRDGQLSAEQRKTASGAVVTLQSNQYDAARGLLLATVDGSGRRVEFRYDAAGRVLQRIEDPAGMALVTQYAYDGQGRQLSVTDASGRLTEYSYDREGRLVQVARDPAGLGMLTRYSYDVAGRTITLVEGSGSLARTTQYQYDLLGRRIAEVVDPGTGRLNLTTSYAYDAADNLIRRTDANGQVTRFYYDAANRLVYTVDPLGALTKNWYDAAGRVVATRAFLQATDASTLEDASTIAQIDLRLAWNPADKLTYFVIDGDGRVRWTLRANGEVEESSFDVAGRLIANRNYATKFTISTALASRLLAGTVVPGEITATRNDALDQRTYRVLDAAGQPRLLVDGQGNVKQLQYDLAGRLAGTLAYSRPAVLTAELRAQLEAGSATIAGILAVVTADATKDMVEYRVHDAAGRLRYSIDAIGAVHETLLDGSGKVYGERGYAVPLTITTALRGKLQAGTATAAEIAALLAPNIEDARNTESYSILDAAGQARYTVKIVADIAGARSAYISELRYDTLGRVYESIEREARVGESALTPVIAALRDGSAQISSVSGWIGTTLRRIAWVRDAAGRVRYTATLGANSLWYVSEQRLDAAGQVVADIKYAGPVALGNTRTEATMQAAVTTAGGDAAAQQRITRYVRDAAGQLRYQIDDAGAVVEYRYDGAGRVVETRQYAVLISTNTAATEAAVATAVAAQTGSNVRVSKTAYDAGSQVAKTTDAAGNVEEFAYDGIGRRISYKNKLGNQWTYAYDAAGRLTQEVSPKVVVASAGLDGAVATVSRSITTAIAYDALGNVISRTEDAAGTVPRTTQYQYDNRGNQVRIVFPDAWRVNAAGQFEASGQALSIDVVYDALGRAVVQKDVNGSYSYKVYDSLDRVAFEVDADGYVTGYTYNAFGEVTQLRRYTKAISTADIAGFVPGKPLLLSDMTATVIVTNTNDRILTTTYDTRGLKATVKQQTITYTQLSGATATASPTTQFTYNGFGELVRTSVLLDEAANLWADSWQYYDDLGRTVLTVDAEGYVTGTRYNAMGEAVEVREYARALSPTAQAALTTETPPANPAAGEAGIGYDRVVAYTYDVMGRKQSETVLRRFDRADGSQGARNVVTQWNYDAAGQMVMVDLDGQQSRTSYDAMGRVSALQEAAQLRLVSNAESQLLGTTAVDLGAQGLYVLSSAYTAMAYDAFGNAVRVIRYANGLQQGQSSPVGDSVNDQVSVTAYDRQGRAVMNRDALGQQVFLQYDASDHVVHSWYTLTGNDGRTTAVHSYYSYDGAGRQLSSRTQRDGAATPDQLEVVRYNAFGEIVAKGNDDAAGATLPATYQYDRAGNLISTNAEGGSVRQYGYNLAGYQVREQHAVYNGTGTTTAVTRYITDRLGRTTGMVLPSNTIDANQVNYLSQVVDRWGNVLQLVDPRGYQTTNQYNDRDQLVKQVLPLVKVVTNSAAGTWMRPERSWSYDELGRLVASRDGNGNTTRYEYDGAGKKIKVIDANGSITQMAYDVLGRERLVQNALGYVTFKQYDRLDRVTAHGDYLPNSAGSARTKMVLESYVLNQNGQRLQSTNAANNTYKYDYDSQGQLIRSQTPMGVVMEYAYDLGGRRSLERYALSHANVVDRDGETVRTNEQTWDYDYFGRLIDHNDLSGRDYNYTYDAASGQLIKETNSSGLDRSTTYFANGQVQSVQEVGGGTYNYAYDQAGNRILEQIQVTDSRGKFFNLKTQIVYDSHNRLQRVVQDDVSNNQRVFELGYDYDAAGNRTHVVARSGYGENSLPIPVANAAPEVIGLPSNRTVRTGVESQFRVRLSDLFRDPEGKALSVTAGQVSAGVLTALPAWLTYSVDVNSGEAVFQAAAGSSAANNQTFRLRLTANDGGATAQVEFDLNVRANTAPELRPGATTTVAIKTGRPWAMEMPVDSYFLDQDVGDSLKLTGNISPAGSGLILDASNPSVLRLSGMAPATGTYTLTLVATDQLGATRSRTISLKVAVNAAPTVVAGIPAQQETRGHSFILEKDLSQVFVDNQGDSFNVTASLDNGLPLPPWLNFSFKNNQAVPQLLFSGDIPKAIADGTIYTIRLTATDVDGASSSTTFTLKVLANRAPTVVSSLPSQELRVGQAVTLQLSAASLFSDPDSDAMSYELLHPDGVANTGWMKLSVDQETGQLTLNGTPTVIGSFSVQLRARDIEGATSLVTMTLQVKGDNAPVRNGSVPLYDQVVKIGRAFTIALPAGLFTDADGDQVSIGLRKAELVSEFWDGTNPGWITWVDLTSLPEWMVFDAATRTISGTVPAGTSPQEFVIKVIANDGRKSSYTPRPIGQNEDLGAKGNASDSDFYISVVPFTNSAPVYTAGALPNRTVKHGDAIDFSMPPGSFTEPDGDALTYSAEVLVGGVWVSISSMGLAINASTGRITGTANNLVQTSYSARVIARDPQGASAVGSFTFFTANTAPTVTSIPAQTVGRNAASSFGVANYFSDVNGDVLTFSAAGLPAGLSISSVGVISGAATASLGAYTVTVTAVDGRGGTVSSVFTLTVANSAPVAPAIANQTAAAGSAWSFTLPVFTDPNGDALTYTVSGTPGWMSFNASTRVLGGTPKEVGSWTITVTANDPAGAAVSKSFTVTTPNVAPVVSVAIPAQSASRNIAWTYQIPAATFSDVNGDLLTYSVSGLPAGLGFTTATRTLAGSPTAPPGTYTIIVTATDGNGGSRSTNLVLNILNTAPTYVGGLTAKLAQEGQAVSWAMPAGAFKDANGDGISYSLKIHRPGYMEVYWDATEAAYLSRWVESVWIDAYSLTINASTGTISGTPPLFYEPATQNSYGKVQPNYAVKVVATDPYGATAEGVFSVTVNLAPVGPVPRAQTIKSRVAWSLTLSEFSDANGDTLTYAVSGLPAGLTFNSSTRVISGSAQNPGNYTVTISANDGKGGVGTTSFVLTVQANTAPSAPSIPNLVGTVGTAMSYLVPAFSDADSDVLTYSASGLPAGITFNAASRTVSGTPTVAGTYSIVITANDGRGGSVTGTLVLTVNNVVVPNRKPVINKQAASPAHTFYSTNRYIVYPESFYLPVDSFADPDNNPLTYSIVQKPSWLTYTFDAVRGHTFYGKYPGTTPYISTAITIRAADPSGAYVDMTFSVAGQYDYYDPWNPTDPLRVVVPGQQLFSAGEEVPAAGGQDSTQAADAVALATTVANSQEAWYSYSKLNQAVVSGGVVENGQIVVAKNYSSYSNIYDAVGNSVAQTQLRQNGDGSWRATIIQHNFSLRGELLLTFGEVDLNAASRARVVERRAYDDAGRTIQQLRYFSPGTIYRWVDRERTPLSMDVSGMLSSAELTTYDADGRLVAKVIKERSDRLVRLAPYGSNVEWSFPEWLQELESGGGLDQYSDLDVLTDATSFSYSGGNNGYDEAGRVRAYTYTGKGYSHNYTYAYAGWDSFREQSVTGTSSSSSYKTTTTISTYDNGGRQTELREKTVGVTMDDRVRSFALDGNGQIISRRDGTVTSGNVFQQKNAQGQAATGNVLGYMNQRIVYANGQQVAGLNEGGKIDVLSRLTAFSNSDSGKTQVMVQAGDTLRKVAQRIYGNENLWYIIAEANALNSDGDLVAGASLTVPEVKTNSNDANTFKPYNPSEITGPTTPSLPYIQPPSAGGCGALGMIIMVVVIIVVSVYTAGAASGAVGGAMTSATSAAGSTAFATAATAAGGAATLTTTGAVVAGAIGGAAGAAAGVAAGTALGSAMGVASFSWGAVGSAALAGAVTGGFNSYATATGLGALSSAVGSAAANYAGQRMTGQDTAFSWRSVAISAVSNVAGQRSAPSVISTLGITSNVGASLASGVAGGMVSAALRAGAGGALNQQDYLAVALDGIAAGISSSTSRMRQRTAATEPVGWDMRYALASTKGAGTSDGLSNAQFDALLETAGVKTTDLEGMTVRPGPELLGASLGINLGPSSVALDMIRDDRRRSNAIDVSAFNSPPANRAIPLSAPAPAPAPRYQPTPVQPESIPIEPMGITPASLVGAYLGHSFAAQDQALLAIKEGMSWLRGQSLGIVDNAQSPAEAAVGSVVYAINSVTDAVVAGAVDTARLATNAQERAQFVQGMKALFTTNPMTTASAAWGHWEQLSTEERLINGAAMLVSLPKGVTSASVLADVMPIGSASGYVPPRAMIGAVGDLDRVPNAAGNAAPYSARSFGEVLEARYPGQVGSRTLPGVSEKNVGLAGTRHPVSGVVFDSRGFPIFDDVAAFDTRIAAKYSSVENSGAHMRAATRDLREAISRGEVDPSQFRADQLRAIQGGKATIPDLTWHHHQDIGRMQLIPFKIHQQTGHIGGYEIWFR